MKKMLGIKELEKEEIFTYILENFAIIAIEDISKLKTLNEEEDCILFVSKETTKISFICFFS